MAHSIEGRVPFLDHKLVEFVWQLPMRLKLHDSTGKYVLRKAFADRFPASSETGNKMFLAPSLETLGLGEKNSLFEDYLSPSFAREVGIFDAARLNLIRRIVRYLPRHSYYRGILETVLVFALSVHLLHDLFCRNFSTFTEQFSTRALTYDLREGGQQAGLRWT